MILDWARFTPGAALLGGAMIGAAAALLLLGVGRIAGISGVLGGLLARRPGDVGWRLAFLAGLIVSPWVASLWVAAGLAGPLRPTIEASWTVLILAGLLVGYGVRLGNGCTSGHGVCGLANLSPRSLAAVLAFMAAGFATVFLVRHGGGL